MSTNWDEIAKNAGQSTDKHFKSKISSLTRLNDEEIEEIITDSGISKSDLAMIIKEIQDTAKSNTEKARAIQKINKGIDVIVGLASKLI